MRMYDLILKKKEGAALCKEEIQWMINAFTTGEIPDYQMSAMLMAICFQGMNHDETRVRTSPPENRQPFIPFSMHVRTSNNRRLQPSKTKRLI